MVINVGSLNFGNTPLQQVQRTQSGQGEAFSFVNNRLNGASPLDRRFDIFINQASENFISNIKTKVESAMMNILCMSAEDRRHMAFMSKENMKRLTKDAIEHEKEELEKFNSLKEEKAYYESVLEDGCYVEKGKYGLKGLKKVKASESEVRQMLDAVQGKIDDIVTAKAAKESDPFDTKTFEYLYSGAMFLAAADMRSAEAAVVKDSSISGQWTRTEENYVSEAAKSIESLEKRMKDIDKMHMGLVNDHEFEKRVSEETLNEKQNKVSALADIFNSWNQRTFLKLMMSESVEAQRLNEQHLDGRISELLRYA